MSTFVVTMSTNNGGWLENAYSRSLFLWAILGRKAGQTDLVLGALQGFISTVGVCMPYYNSLCAAVTISATLVNMQTHTDGDHFG